MKMKNKILKTKKTFKNMNYFDRTLGILMIIIAILSIIELLF